MVFTKTPIPKAKGTRLVTRIAQPKKPKKRQKRAPRVVLGAPDGRVTPRAGLHLVAKLNELLGISRTIDAASAPIKSRRRGLSLGKVLVSLAETMLGGGDFLVDLDYQRKDTAGLRLRAVPEVPASTTVTGLGKRFSAAPRQSVEQANAALVAKAVAFLAEARRDELADDRSRPDRRRGLRGEKARLRLQLSSAARDSRHGSLSNIQTNVPASDQRFLARRAWRGERAGDGNRTRTTSLEGWSSTIELRPRCTWLSVASGGNARPGKGGTPLGGAAQRA